MLLDAACGCQQMNINNVSLQHSVGFCVFDLQFEDEFLNDIYAMPILCHKIPNSVSDEYYCGYACLFWNSTYDCDGTVWYVKYGSVRVQGCLQ